MTFRLPITPTGCERPLEQSERLIELLRPQMSERRFRRLEQTVARRIGGVRVVLDGLYDPGNRSAVYRTAEGLGLYQVDVVRPQLATKKHARAVSRGAEKWLGRREFRDVGEAVAALRDDGFRLLVSDLRAARPLQPRDFVSPVALVFGNEHAGASDEMLEAADDRFYLPMHGLVESFNVSVAAALALDFARRSRTRAVGAQTDLTAGQRSALLAEYLVRSTGWEEERERGSDSSISP